MILAKRLLWAGVACAVGMVGADRARAQAGDRVIISELVASNFQALADYNEDFTDWIELFNPSPNPVSLAGWHLTDDSRDMAKWPFPDVTMAPGEFLVVFASGKDLRDPARELHTNFQLSGQGEFLALVHPSGIPASAFSPSYPPQVEDVSYGSPMTFSVRKLLPAGSAARYLVPPDSSLAQTWVAPDFDDAAWSTGALPLGFDTKDPPTYREEIVTDVAAPMATVASSIYLRLPFTVAEDDAGRRLRVRLAWEDGFVAWLNGVEVLRSNFTGTRPTYSSRANASRSEAEAVVFTSFPLQDRTLLRAGANVLAIQLLNVSRTDPDVFVDAEIETADVESTDLENVGYFLAPTPGFPNAETVLPALAAEPGVSEPSGAFTDNFFVELTGASPDTQIRYTLDGFEPTEGSSLYTEPVAIDRTLAFKAKAFRPGHAPSATASRVYLKVAPALASVSSNLPIAFCVMKGATLGANCGGGAYTPGFLVVFAPGPDGRARLTGAPHVAEMAAFRRRGSSTCTFPKQAMNVEVKKSADPDKRWSQTQRHDPLGATKDVSIFGFPADADFVLHGGNNFDRSMMRNPIAYWMSLEVGKWAARSRFVEVYFVNSAQPVAASSSHYWGVYAFMEKNKQHPDRIDVESLGPANNSMPEIQGGYAFRRDRVGAGEMSTSITAQGTAYGSLVYVHPRYPSTAQNQWITAHLNAVMASLSPNIGSQEDTDMIDVQGWLDDHILNWYTKNVDAYRLSGYFYKPRYGPMVMGPLWDFDRTMGCSDDDRANNPEGWNNTASGDGGTVYFGSGGMGSWYSILFQNQPPTGTSPWAKAYRQRWRELRAGPLATENIVGQIDRWAAEIAPEAAARNYAKWAAYPPRGGFQGEVNLLKNWLSRRADWIDAQFIEEPAISPPGGRVDAGTQVTISASEGEIFYTIDGSDPKTTTNQVGPTAAKYVSPITVVENVKVRARLRIGTSTWSNIAEQTYITKPLTLAVSEIMYNAGVQPPLTQSASYYDFLEILNYGSEPVSLEGVELTRPRFVFSTASTILTLGAGERLVLCYRLEGMQEKYGDIPNLAGRFTTSLSDTRLTIEMKGPIGEPVLTAAYEDSWYPSTDGQGYSLVLKNPLSAPETWVSAEAWEPSGAPGGSPGRGDEVPNQLPADVSQDGVLTITDAVALLEWLFLEGTSPCATSEGNLTLMDTNGDGKANISDPVHLLGYLFLGGPAPALGTACVAIPGCPEVCGGT